MLKSILPFVLTLALCSPAFADEDAQQARLARPHVEYITSVTVIVYGFYPATPTSGAGTWSQSVRLEQRSDDAFGCEGQIVAMEQIVAALEAHGIDFVEGVACVPTRRALR